MYYEEDPTRGSRIARFVATLGAVGGGSMLAASCSSILIREVTELNSNTDQNPYANSLHQAENFDSTIELSAQLGVAGLGVAVVGLAANSIAHAIQRRRL